jgi:SAM-dependent methyltransferase
MSESVLELRDIDCLFCGKEAPSSERIRENGFVGRQCHRCGLIYISPRPTLGEIVDLYGHGEAHVSAESHLASGFSKRLYARNSLGIIRRYRKSGDLLEVGAGAGFFLDEARKAGFNPFAIEFNPSQVAHISGPLGIRCEAKPLAADPFPGQSFDVIYHCDVISHFYDPIAEFRSFHAALRAGGLLVFETGNLGDVDPRYYGAIERFQYPDHLFFFSAGNIESLLEATGFELLAVHRYAILLDLWTTRARTALRRLARKWRPRVQATPLTGAAQGQATTTHTGARTSGPFGWLKAADQYVSYFVRYRVGSIMPRSRRPQTIIFVARKIPASPARLSSKR